MEVAVKLKKFFASSALNYVLARILGAYGLWVIWLVQKIFQKTPQRIYRWVRTRSRKQWIVIGVFTTASIYICNALGVDLLPIVQAIGRLVVSTFEEVAQFTIDNWVLIGIAIGLWVVVRWLRR